MHFEENYPIEARTKEISQIASDIIKGQSCQLISIPGAGRSTIMRLLAYHEKLREYNFKQHASHLLFIYLNLAECSSFEISELHKFLFYSLVNSLKEGDQTKKEAEILFQQSLKTQDPLVMFQNLKKAVELLNSQNYIPVFLFDRFSEFARQIPDRFFADLKNLRRATLGRLTVVFSTHYPLEKLLMADQWQDFWEFFAGAHVFVELNDPVTTNFRIVLLEKETGKILSEHTKEKLVELTSGHGKLMKVSTQLLLSQEGTIQDEDLQSFLLSHILIQGSLLEIWQALSKEDQQILTAGKTNEVLDNLQLPFPLFAAFIKSEQKVKKEIRFEEGSNEIYFGDQPVEELTSHEFKLLRFLISNPNRVITRDEIIENVWSDEKTREGVSDEALSQMIYRLRKKVEDEADSPKHLLTIKGRGIRFMP